MTIPESLPELSRRYYTGPADSVFVRLMEHTRRAGFRLDGQAEQALDMVSAVLLRCIHELYAHPTKEIMQTMIACWTQAEILMEDLDDPTYRPGKSRPPTSVPRGAA